MNRLVLLLLSLLFCAASGLSAQVGIIVQTRTPMPSKISDWQRDRSLFQVILTNPAGGQEYRNARISFAIREFGSERLIAKSKDDSPFIPRFTIPAGASTTIRFGADIINEQATTIDRALQNTVSTTNSIPEGSYEFCVRLFDETGKELGATGEICRLFNVTIPDPPSLILPENASLVPHNTLPNFVWTGVQSAGNIIRYKIKVAPVYSGQNERFAIDYNPAMYEKITTATSIRYGQDGALFSMYPMAIGFAWQVQALNERNEPATRNDGKSEIFTFRFGVKKGTSDDTNSDTTSTGNDNGNGGGGIGGGSTTGGKDTSSTSGSTGGSTRFSVVKRIRVGEFTLALDQTQTCYGNCTLSGTGKIHVAILNDSIPVNYSGITVINKKGEFFANGVGNISSQLNSPKNLTFQALKLSISSMTWSLDKASLSGSLALNWAALLLGNGTSTVPVSDLEFAPNAIKTALLPIAWKQTGTDIGFGSCLSLVFDTLSFGVRLQFSEPTVQSTLSGAAVIPCLLSENQPVTGRFRLPVDRISSDNLLLTLTSVNMQDVRIGTLPLNLTTSTLLLDLSAEANFPAVSTSSSCFYNPSWSHPLWRGIIIPTAQVMLKMPSGSFTFESQNLLLEPISNELKLSVKGHDGKNKILKYGGFSILLDSLSLDLCQSTLQQLTAVGTLQLAASHPKEWKALDSIKIGLNSDATWNWHATMLSKSPISLSFGTTALIQLQNGAIGETAPDEGYLQWSKVQMMTPTVNPTGTAQFSVKLRASNGKFSDNIDYAALQLQPTLTVDNIPFTAKEAGFGIMDGKWWCGFSGGAILPDESGIQGVEVKHVRIVAGTPLTITSDATPVNLSVGSAMTFKGNLMYGDLPNAKSRGLHGELTANIHAFAGLTLPMHVTLGAHPESGLYWKANGGEILNEGIALTPEFHLLGGVVGAGWNVQITGYDSSAVDIDANGGALTIPNITPSKNSPLQLKAGLLFASSNHRLFRFAAGATLESTGAGTLGTVSNVSGTMSILPSLGLARGNVFGQFSMASKGEKTISLSGMARTWMMGTSFENCTLHTDFTASESKILIGNITKKWTALTLTARDGRTLAGNDIHGTITPEFENATLVITPTSMSFAKDVTGSVAVGGDYAVGTTASTTSGTVTMQSPICTKLTYSLAQSPAVMSMYGAMDRKNTASVWLDNFTAIGVTQPLSVLSRVKSAFALEYSFSAKEIAVRMDNSTTTLMLDAFAENGKQSSIKGMVSAECLGNSWQKELGNPTVLTCDDLQRVTAQTGQRISVSITGATCVLENTTKMILPKGMKINVQTTIRRKNAGGEISNDTKIVVVDLPSDLAPGNTFIIPQLPDLSLSSIDGIQIIIRPDNPTLVTQICTSSGSLSCP